MQSIIITALITAALCITGGVAYGQTFSEWWLQKKTRIKYLHQQIAALEELRKLLREGYEAAEGGVDSIGTITNEELSMHSQFLLSLKLVKPPVKDSPEVVSSYALVATLVARVGESMNDFTQAPEFAREDILWLGTFLSNMIRDVRQDLRMLDELTTDGALEMSDEERLGKIRATEQKIRVRYWDGMTFLLKVEELLDMGRQQRANEDFVRHRL